jgi:transposase
VPEETARVARAVFPKGHNLYLKMRDELGIFFEDQQFAALFPTKGQPAEAPWRLALVTIFQFMENLSDRAAAEAVRSRIDWKYALCLNLSDPGFDYSVLSKFRSRLLAGQAEQQLLDSLLQRFKEKGLLTARGKARTDSTHVLAAVHKFNRIAQLGETVRAALNDLAVVAPDWLRTIAPPQWYERYGKAFDDSKVPSGDDKRKILAETIGQDGRLLLTTIYTSPSW